MGGVSGSSCIYLAAHTTVYLASDTAMYAWQARMAGVSGNFEARRAALQRLLLRKAPSPSGAQVLHACLTYADVC